MTTRLKINMLLTNSAILFSIVLAIAFFVYTFVNVNILNSTDSELLESSIALRGYFPYLDRTAPELEDDYRAFEQSVTDSFLAFTVWDENLKSQTDPLYLDKEKLKGIALLAFSPETLANVYDRPNGRFYMHDYSFDGNYYRICTSVTSDDFGRMRITQLISNMDEKQAMSQRLLNALIIAGVAGMAVSFIFGLVITNKAVRPIEESVRRQKQFVADASHELRTPITVVRTNLDVVLASGEDSVQSQMHWLENAYRETERMQKLIDELLLLARSDLSQLVYEFAPTNVTDLLKVTVDRMKEIAATKNIEIILDAPSVPLPCMADASRLEQLFMILLDNAITYSASGSDVTVTAQPTSATTMRVAVADEGIGIEPEEYDKIFERFYRSDKARSRRQGGTGLGLAIARMIVDAHNGSIWASSIMNEGATIIVELPMGVRNGL